MKVHRLVMFLFGICLVLIGGIIMIAIPCCGGADMDCVKGGVLVILGFCFWIYGNTTYTVEMIEDVINNKHIGVYEDDVPAE